MRMYAHDYVWGVQDRRSLPAPGFGLIDAAFWLHRRLRRALASRARAVAPRPDVPRADRGEPGAASGA